MHRTFKAVLLAAALTLVPSAALAADYDARRVIVQFAPGADTSSLAAAAGAGQRIATVAHNGAQVLRTATDSAVVARRLDALPGVVYAEPDVTLHTLAIPNDPRFGELYGIHNTGQSAGKVDADLDGPEGWDLAGLGAFPNQSPPPGAKVGIVDTGIDKTHPDLAGKVANCAGASQGVGGLVGGGTVSESNTCVDDNDHGTHVAGTISGNANNGIGVAGVAFNSPLAICKALFGPLGQGNTTGVANCITYLAGKGVKVISMSLGGGASTTLQTAVRNAYNNGNGALLVAAAGNDGDATLNYPAAYPEVVSVAATDRKDQRASFSNANSDVEVASAGVDVLSTVRGGTYRTLSGTSMATPHVAGVAALIATKNPTFTAAQVRSKLTTGVDDLGAPGRDTAFGFGRVTLTKALG